jgi:hypothetical protein
MLILSSHLSVGIPNCFFPSRFHIKIPYTFLLSFMRAAYPVNLIVLDFMFQLYLAMGARYEAPHYAVFSNLE